MAELGHSWDLWEWSSFLWDCKLGHSRMAELLEFDHSRTEFDHSREWPSSSIPGSSICESVRSYSSTIPGNGRAFYGRASSAIREWPNFWSSSIRVKSSSIRGKVGKFDHSQMVELGHSRMVQLLWESLLDWPNPS